MNQMPSEILSLTNEAAVLIRRGKADFANAAARSILGDDCVGKTTRALFGADVAGAQAASFVASVSLVGRSYIVRMTKMADEQIVFFSSPDVAPAVANDPFLCELRGGLMNISMAADTVRQTADQLQDPALLSTLSSLTRSYYRLLRLTANASLVLNASEGGLPLSFSRIDISALCRSALEMIQCFCPASRFQTELDDSLFLVADPGLVRQLLFNLISNCMLHAGENCLIRISLLASAGSVVLSVSDNGCGIEPEALHTVFDRYRHSFRMAELNSGPGLGLTVARAITMAHGGTLLLESRPGRGTTVRASFSRDLNTSAQLRAPDCGDDSLVRDILVGLSGCLPIDCYTEQYMD